MTRLPPQPWLTAAPTRRVMEALEKARPGCARFVGGCVRNSLMGEEVADIDIATQLTPDVVEQVMKAAGIAVHPTGIEHGTLTVVANHHPFEVTTLRRDVETDGRRATVAFTEDWAEDAQRRDFRMNALYAGLDGEIFDPTGGGLEDVRLGRVIFVGDPETRIREDYLRILRLFRFHARYGKSAPDAAGLEACARLKAGLKVVSVERVWMEFKKLLAAPDPVPALQSMIDAGVMGVVLEQAEGVDLLARLIALERAVGLKIDPMLRFLSLFWKDEKRTAETARKLKLSNDERDFLVFAARMAEPLNSATPDIDARRMLYRFTPEVVGANVALEWAKAGADAKGWARLKSLADGYKRPELPVTGDDALAAGVAPGPDIGKVLRRAEAAWIDSDFQLSRDQLLATLRG
jgi:poly(A) polymerase